MSVGGPQSRYSASSQYRHLVTHASHADLSRARSDESLAWAAGEEAAALVAELRASIPFPRYTRHTCASITASAPPKGARTRADFPPTYQKARSFSNLSVVTSAEDLRCCPCGESPPSTPPPRHARKGGEPHWLPPVTRASTGAKSPSRALAGSWRSLVRMGSLSSRSKAPLLASKKVSPPVAPSTTHPSSSSPSPSPSPSPSFSSPSSSPPFSSSSSSSSSCRHSGCPLAASSLSGRDCPFAAASSSCRVSGADSSSAIAKPPRSPSGDSGGDALTALANGGAALGNVPTFPSGMSSLPPHAPPGAVSTFCGASVSANHASSAVSPSHYRNGGASQFLFPVSQMPSHFVHLMCSKPSPNSPSHSIAAPKGGPQWDAMAASKGEPPPYATSSFLPHHYTNGDGTDDQGIDMQSPGRCCSPGSGITTASSSSSSCSSGAFLTGGAASGGSSSGGGASRVSTASVDSGRASNCTHAHRLSGASYDSGSVRHSYHSSSSSLGSLDAPEPPPLHTNVKLLLAQDVPDSEVLSLWLSELRMEEYAAKFVCAGYDLRTISRMTPEDLNAVGVTRPAHRKRLRAEINRLDISDGLPDYIPPDLAEWLRLLGLDSYCASLIRQGVSSVAHLTQLAWEDLDDVGITKLGHQKKMMLGIKRAKDILSGKVAPTPAPSHPPPPVHHYRPEVVAVGVRPRPRAPDEAHYATYRTFLPPQTPPALGPPPPPFASPPPRSFDDGDITPTNEGGPPPREGGGTLPRPRQPNKHRPVAMVTAKTRAHVHAAPPLTPKHRKPPPPAPPRRCHSVGAARDAAITPDVAVDLPPPPPAPYDSGNHAHEDLFRPSTDQKPHPTRADSNSSFKSNSSTDSGCHSLPFANTNAGTIKPSGGSATIKTPHEGTALQLAPPATSPPDPQRETERDTRPSAFESTPKHAAAQYTKQPSPVPCHNSVAPSGGGGDVLSAIGHMLASLTDELDAMLDQDLAPQK